MCNDNARRTTIVDAGRVLLDRIGCVRSADCGDWIVVWKIVTTLGADNRFSSGRSVFGVDAQTVWELGILGSETDVANSHPTTGV